MNRLNRLFAEADAVWRDPGSTPDEAIAAGELVEAYGRLRGAVRYQQGRGPVVWYDWCDICGWERAHEDQSDRCGPMERERCPCCGCSWDRLLVVDGSDPRDLRMFEDHRAWLAKRRAEYVERHAAQGMER